MLNEDRRRQLLVSIVPDDGRAAGLVELCTAGVEITELSGAGIMLMTGNEPQAALYATNSASELIEELQFTYGGGRASTPTTTACRSPNPTSQTLWCRVGQRSAVAPSRAVFGRCSGFRSRSARSVSVL